MTPPQPLVLFDGPCTLCQRAVRFILRHESSELLHFASLQSDCGKTLINQFKLPENIDAMVLIENDQASYGSTAALKVCKYLKNPWRCFYRFHHLPSWMHQPLYTFIARRRYKWFGKDESCPLPEPRQSERFLS